jgi:hypothetical protein
MDTIWKTNASKEVWDQNAMCAHKATSTIGARALPWKRGQTEHPMSSVELLRTSAPKLVKVGSCVVLWQSGDRLVLLVVNNSDYSIVNSVQELTEHWHADTPNLPKFWILLRGFWACDSHSHFSLSAAVPPGSSGHQKAPGPWNATGYEKLQYMRRYYLSDGIAAYYCSILQHH